MFIAQLSAFLLAHHHHHWAWLLFHHVTPREYLRILHWAIRHGFIWHP